jgi:carnitine 3-dehydrogenase
MDVPELTDDLVKKIADQSDAQSGARTIRELERLRDTNLVSILRALKGRGNAAGAVIKAHEGPLLPADPAAVPMVTLRRVIPIDWTDYNGHMNESRYGQIWSDAADAVLLHAGVDAAYVEGGLSYFTLETKTNFLSEALAGDRVEVLTRVTQGAGKKLRLFHEMRRGDEVCATCDQFLVHVSLETRKSCDPAPEVCAAIEALAAAHAEQA